MCIYKYIYHGRQHRRHRRAMAPPFLCVSKRKRNKGKNRKSFKAEDIIRLSPTLRVNCPYSELFWSILSVIQTEYGKILRICQY